MRRRKRITVSYDIMDVVFGKRAVDRGYTLTDLFETLKTWNTITLAWENLWNEANQGRDGTQEEAEEDFHLIVRMREKLEEARVENEVEE
jgi:hypothetical protein